MTARPFTLAPAAPSEAQVLRAVLHALSVHPKVAKAWRMQTGAGKLVRGSGHSQWLQFGFTGCPDVMGYTKQGIALFVEVKRPGGSLRPEQKDFLRAAEECGCIAFTARSVEDVYAFLETM